MKSQRGRPMKTILLVVLFLSIVVGALYGWMKREELSNQTKMREENQTEITEDFIYRWLQNENGMIATYIKNSSQEDEDLVQGREVLAETLGLLMDYALDNENQTLFNTLYKQLTDYFLEKEGFVNWKLKEDGTSDVSANALIDDIRILDALAMAAENWKTDQYKKTALSISEYLNEKNVVNGIYTDFYDKEYGYASSEISLSYIDIQGMNTLVNQGLLDAEIVAETSQVLTKAPLDHGFYPVSYNVEEKEYIFSDNINLVDQAILAYHYAQVGNRSLEFLTFIKSEMDKRGLIHGMYDRKTKEPTVDYESPAIYGFLILYALEVDEHDLAQALYDRMKEFQVVDKKSEYYGGYSITNGDTHIFDNLIPLLAEQEMKKD